jgi:hypothetical protein
MTEADFTLIQRHLRGALMGEPTPTLRGPALGPLLQALAAPLNPDMPLAARQAALARVGLLTVQVLCERSKAGMVAERELALLGNRGRS